MIRILLSCLLLVPMYSRKSKPNLPRALGSSVALSRLKTTVSFEVSVSLNLVAYQAKAKVQPSKEGLIGDWRVRHDKVDRFGKLTLRRAKNFTTLG